MNEREFYQAEKCILLVEDEDGGSTTEFVNVGVFYSRDEVDRAIVEHAGTEEVQVRVTDEHGACSYGLGDYIVYPPEYWKHTGYWKHENGEVKK